MNCSTCGNRMQGGYLQSSTDINWIPDLSSDQKNPSTNPKKLFELLTPSSKIYAYRCVVCKKIEISLNQESKYNHVTCPKCGNSIEASSRFCNACGQEIQKATKESQFTCLNCNNPVDVDDITCPYCGVELDQFANDILNTCVECGYSDPSLENLAECPQCGALLPI